MERWQNIRMIQRRALPATTSFRKIVTAIDLLTLLHIDSQRIYCIAEINTLSHLHSTEWDDLSIKRMIRPSKNMKLIFIVVNTHFQ